MFESAISLHQKFQALYDELSDHVVEVSADDVALRRQAKSLYYSISAQMKTVGPDHVSHSFAAPSPTPSCPSGPSRAKLPPITVPTFDGQRTQWPRFRDTFMSLVIGDPSFHDIDRYHYLVHALKDNAAAIIAPIPFTEADFPVAWNALLEAFDNPRLLATAYLDRLMHMPTLPSKPSPDQLKRVSSEFSECIASFNNIPIDDKADFILFYLLRRVLDCSVREDFERCHDQTKFPRCDDIIKFLRDRCIASELAIGISQPITAGTVKAKQSRLPYKGYDGNKTALMISPSAGVNRKQSIGKNISRPSNSLRRYSPSVSVYQRCYICSGAHTLLNCSTYNSMSVKERVARLQTYDGCQNCLFPSHSTDKCTSKDRCRFCRGLHHSTLHLLNRSVPTSSTHRPPTPPKQIVPTISRPNASLNTTAGQTQVLLGTALCSILDAKGISHTIRIVLDSGSQFSFLSSRMAERLDLDVRGTSVDVLGIGKTPFMGFKGRAHCSLVSFIEPVRVTTQALVIDEITSDLPTLPLSLASNALFEQYPLADPDFGVPRPVDFLLGGDLFADILTGELVTVADGQPKLIGTIFGYVIIGRVADLSEVQYTQALCATRKAGVESSCELREDLEHLWALEEPPAAQVFNPADIYCEQYFKAHHYRLPTGRYVVRLPFKANSPPQFTSTRWMALKRLTSVENRLARNPNLYALYKEFMQDYEASGHMELTTRPAQYIIPHHSVLKLDGNGKQKIRVVFDASAHTSSGSLNEHLHVGPKLHGNLVEITLNFRRHRVCFTVDVQQMFRQILIHPDDRVFQHILWRDSPDQPVREYELCTVSYGQACAPFLAIRSLHQLVADHGTEFPLAAAAILNDMYVDDLPTGAETVETALELQRQVIGLMARGEFPLSKWASNHPQLLEVVDPSNKASCEQPRKIETFDERARLKILGLQWNPVHDCFSFEVQLPELILTKRAILAAVSRIYDPLGLLGPVVISAKAIIQLAWKAGLDWDETLPTYIQSKWKALVLQLPQLSKIHIPRCVCPAPNAEYDLLIFGDASELAYSSVAYLRSTAGHDTRIHLLCSRCKLAPIKPVSIPRLELCAALLTSRLLESLTDFCSKLPQAPRVHLFTDSTVVLGWLKTPPHQLQTFVANRVVQILEMTNVDQWAHVRSGDNPGDLGSRGLTPMELANNVLWFEGPPWSCQPSEFWPVKPLAHTSVNRESLPEIKGAPCLTASNPQEHYFNQFIYSCSSFTRLIRTFACVLRFIRFTREPRHLRRRGPYSCKEMCEATNVCLKVTQQQGFNHGNNITLIPAQLSMFNPFLDKDGVLRVGGRIALSGESYSICHPILLPASSHLTRLIFDHYHRALMHPGPTLLLAAIRRKFWIVRGRNLIKKWTRDCIACRKRHAKPCQPIMAGLPAERFQGERAFVHVGIDFAGPFLVRDSLRRKAQTSKCYLCLFVCLASKALHLEAVSSLSTPAFLAALDRFVSRRGLPAIIFSDNGSNFVGAANQLRHWYQWFSGLTTQETIHNHLVQQGIEWKFNPPNAPHFGGIWEAGVRSSKRLIHASYGDGALTFEELASLFTRVEAILNSRPLAPLSDDPEDLDALTPGHLLIGAPLIALPEPQLLHRKESCLNRWERVQARTQLFWKRWKTEYLHNLQLRHKWKHPSRNLQTNDLVLLKGEETTRCKWVLGRIIKVHPGADGVVRVATVRTAKGIFKRPAVKLIPLLIS